MAQYPPEVLVIFADGAQFHGRESFVELFEGFFKLPEDGVLRGPGFTTHETFTAE